MESQDRSEPAEAGRIGGRAVTLGTRGNKIRTDMDILNELEDVSRRIEQDHQDAGEHDRRDKN